MDSRLKTTIKCTFMLMRRQLVTIVIIEVIMLLLFTRFKGTHIAAGNDMIPLMYLFLCGMKMFEVHTPFCISNAVSLRSRLVSLGIGAGAMCLFTALSDHMVRYAIMMSTEQPETVTRISAGSIVRYFIHANDLNAGVIFFDIPEMFAIGLGLFSLGYFIGSVRYSRGGGYVLLWAFGAALFMGGCTALSYFRGINFLKFIFMLPAYAMKTRLTSAVFGLLIAAALTAGAVRISESLGENSR